MAKKQKNKLPGCLYQRNGRWWWKVKLPGEQTYKARPLKAAGQSCAFMGAKAVAIEIAKNLMHEAIFKANQQSDELDGTIASLVQAYLVHADDVFRKEDGTPTPYPVELREVMKQLVKYCGSMSIEEFSPKKLKNFRKYLASLKRKVKGKTKNRYCLDTVNKKIKRIKTMFKWATEESLIHSNTYYALHSIRVLKAGQLGLLKSPKVKSVPQKHMEAVLPYATSVIADMILLQFLTGMRSIELTGMQPRNIIKDKDTGMWWYHVPNIYNKNARFGEDHKRIVPIGPKAQKILCKYLLRNHKSFCFSPRESEEQRLVALHKRRKTPLSCGNRPGTNRKENPKKMPGDKYNSQSYGKAVKRAIKAAQKAGKKVPDWTPHQLRHSAATIIANTFDLETARVVLGHKSLTITEIYRDVDLEKITRNYRKLG